MRSGIAAGNNVFKLYDSDTGEEMDGPVTVQLPAFELGSLTFSGAGVAGEIEVPTPGVMNSLAATISTPLIYGGTTNYLKLGTTRTLDLRNDMVVLNKDTHAPQAVPNRWVLKGVLSKSDPGKIEQKASGDASLEMKVLYAHHWLDGEDVLEWDPFKMIYTVNGEDLLAETRQNIQG